jgi:hypothetical protein
LARERFIELATHIKQTTEKVAHEGSLNCFWIAWLLKMLCAETGSFVGIKVLSDDRKNCPSVDTISSKNLLEVRRASRDAAGGVGENLDS